MFPLRDTTRPARFPIINWLLIAANVVVFVFEILLQRQYGTQALGALLETYGIVPAALSVSRPLSFLSIFSSIFLHGGWLHLISNMWVLFIFGDNVEDRMGSGRYLLFYILAGLIAGVTHALFSLGSTVPAVGASGAIAGVMAAYFLLFPGARIHTLILVFIFPWFLEIPAFIFLGLWFLSQLSSGLMNIGAMGDVGGIAWWAHIGGFVFGLLTVRQIARKNRRYR